MAKGRTKKTTNRKQGKSLGICVDAYVAQLELGGKSVPTVRSYHSDLKLLARDIGEDLPVTRILVPDVARHLDSDAFTTKRDGTPKADLSIKKSRRAIRMFLEWVAAQGEIDRVPFPAN